LYVLFFFFAWQSPFYSRLHRECQYVEDTARVLWSLVPWLMEVMSWDEDSQSTRAIHLMHALLLQVMDVCQVLCSMHNHDASATPRPAKTPGCFSPRFMYVQAPHSNTTKMDKEITRRHYTACLPFHACHINRTPAKPDNPRKSSPVVARECVFVCGSGKSRVLRQPTDHPTSLNQAQVDT
jgi:hypothetical protein